MPHYQLDDRSYCSSLGLDVLTIRKFSMLSAPASTNNQDDITPVKNPSGTQMPGVEKPHQSEGRAPRKSRSFLKVPSRSSSRKDQSTSPTSTGLSGVTVGEPRNSIGSRSKDSKGSLMGGQRNGSASSNRTGGDTDATNTPGNSQPQSPTSGARQPKKKSGGLFSLLTCCATPEAANPVEGEPENAHKLEKLPARPATARSRAHTPQEQPAATQLSEKAPEQDVSAAAVKDETMTSAHPPAQASSATAGQGSGAVASGLAVAVDPPSRQQSKPDNGMGEGQESKGEDIEMPDATAEETPEVSQPAATQTRVMPIPPPPPPIAQVIDAGPSRPQKSLLPAIAPEHRGRKCLVLDLDETLVHSSFKVISTRILRAAADPGADPSSSRFHDPG